MIETYSSRTGVAVIEQHSKVTAAGQSPEKAANGNMTRIQCRRCLCTIELDPNRANRRIRCTQCHRHLRMPKIAEANCRSCGSTNRYSGHASGRRAKCRHCGTQVDVPIMVVHSRRRRPRRSTNRKAPTETGVLPLVLSLLITVVGVYFCFRLFSSLS